MQQPVSCRFLSTHTMTSSCQSADGIKCKLKLCTDEWTDTHVDGHPQIDGALHKRMGSGAVAAHPRLGHTSEQGSTSTGVTGSHTP